MLQKLSKCEVGLTLLKDNFPTTQVLREIKFWFFALLEVLNCNFSKFEPFLKYQIYQNSKLRISENVKWAIFDVQIWPKWISHKIEWQIKVYDL